MLFTYGIHPLSTHVVNGICVNLGTMSCKITKFIGNELIKQLDRVLFALVVADIGNDDVAVGIEEFVVFVIGCNEHIGLHSDGF